MIVSAKQKYSVLLAVLFASGGLSLGAKAANQEIGGLQNVSDGEFTFFVLINKAGKRYPGKNIQA